MFNKYYDSIPLLNEKKPSEERINAYKAAVFALIGDCSQPASGTAVKSAAPDEEAPKIYYGEGRRKPKKLPVLIAAAAVTAAAVPICFMRFGGNDSPVGTGEQEHSSPSPAQSGTSVSVSEVVSDEITDSDKALVIKLTESEDREVYDCAMIDIDSDGSDELLVLTNLANPRVFELWRKSGGEMSKECVFGAGKLNFIDKISLKEVTIDGERLFLFTFSYDEGGTMRADEVLSAIVRTDGGFEVEHLLSRGTLSYTDIAEPFTKEFYRRGWNKTDIGFGGGADYGDISAEEYYRLRAGYMVPDIAEIAAMTDEQASEALSGATAKELDFAWGEAGYTGDYNARWICGEKAVRVYFAYPYGGDVICVIISGADAPIEPALTDGQLQNILDGKAEDAYRMFICFFIGGGWEFGDKIYELYEEGLSVSVSYSNLADGWYFHTRDEMTDYLSRYFTEDVVAEYMERVADGKIADGVITRSRVASVIIADDEIYAAAVAKDGYMPPDFNNARVISTTEDGVVFSADREIPEDSGYYEAGIYRFRGVLKLENGEWKFADLHVAERMIE